MIQTVDVRLEATPQEGAEPARLSFWPTQNDSRAYRLMIRLFSGGEAIDCAAAGAIRVLFEKPDGYLVVGEPRLSGGALAYDIGAAELQAAGMVVGAVQLGEGEARLTTQRFAFIVLGDPLSLEALESANAIAPLELLSARFRSELEELSALKASGALNGPSAYEIAVAHGYAGTEAQWLESLSRGPKGDPGESVPANAAPGQLLFAMADGSIGAQNPNKRFGISAQDAVAYPLWYKIASKQVGGGAVSRSCVIDVRPTTLPSFVPFANQNGGRLHCSFYTGNPNFAILRWQYMSGLDPNDFVLCLSSAVTPIVAELYVRIKYRYNSLVFDVASECANTAITDSQVNDAWTYYQNAVPVTELPAGYTQYVSEDSLANRRLEEYSQRVVPPGGGAGRVLAKVSGADYDFAWV